MLVCLATLIVAGLSGGWLWHLLSSTPSYTIGDDYGAIITEQSLSQVFAMDIWYMFIGVGVGMAVGAIMWVLFHKMGWWLVIGVIIGSLLAAVLAWQFGQLLGPRDFAERVTVALPGDRVPMDLQLHSVWLMMIWPMAANLPVLALALWNQFRRVHG